MSSAMKKVNKITQIVRLKHLVQHWKSKSLKLRSVRSYSSSSDWEELGSNRVTPPGTLAVYVGPEHIRFVIPTRFVNLPVFLSLLNKAEEEFGYQATGGLVLPCEVGFFKSVIDLLERDEQRFGGLELDEFVKMFSDDYCKERGSSGQSFKPLLHKTRV